MTAFGALFTLRGKKAFIGNELVSAFDQIPNENLSVFRLGRMGSFFLNIPEDSFMVYLHATDEARNTYRDAVMAGTAKLGIFQRRSGMRSWSSASPLQTVFKELPKDVIAALEVVASDESGFKGKLIVNYMVVRPAWRRNGILLRLMTNLQSKWPKRKFLFDSPTEQGEQFARAVAAMGFPVSKDQKYPHEKKAR